MGIVVDLDKVPQREIGMTPYEILLSESQERMLLVATPENVAAVQAVFAKWDLDAPVIGEVVEGGQARISFKGEIVVDIPVDAVVNLCPAYDRQSVAPAPPPPAPALEALPLPADLGETLLELLASPTIADKEWVFRQYDHMVQVNTVFLPGADAPSCARDGRRTLGKGLALTLDGNGAYVQLEPRTGTKIAVAEACRNLACVGARPIGVTNCLNFANPEKPDVMWQFEQAVAGLAEACRAFGIPVTGGNVSFYNETEGQAVHPTPVIGVVGLVEDVRRALGPGFRRAGDVIVLLGGTKEELGGSEYLRLVHGLEGDAPPTIDLDTEKRVQEVCLAAADRGWLRSAHDLSEGGLAVALAEGAFHAARGTGCVVDLAAGIRSDALLFGESQSRIVVTTTATRRKALLALARAKGVQASVIGRTGGRDIVIRLDGADVIRLAVAEARRIWKAGLPKALRAKS
jgi:phosphoribosylformylglycinamidine synthase